MYRLRKKKSKELYTDYDFVFESFKEFYKQASKMIVKFDGKYNIAILSNSADDIVQFMVDSNIYDHLNIVIYSEERVITFIQEKYVNVVVDGQSSPYDDFLRLVHEKSLLIESKALNILYSSISHDIDEMELVLESLVLEFGRQNMITEKMLSSKVILTNIVYPRQVILEYLRMSRWREVKLNKCLEFMANNIVLYATINNIKDMITQKCKFYTTGMKVNKTLDNVWIDNLVSLYNLFVIERNNISDVVLLYKMYERGVIPYDLL